MEDTLLSGHGAGRRTAIPIHQRLVCWRFWIRDKSGSHRYDLTSHVLSRNSCGECLDTGEAGIRQHCRTQGGADTLLLAVGAHRVQLDGMEGRGVLGGAGFMIGLPHSVHRCGHVGRRRIPEARTIANHQAFHARQV